ncbi:hypothetical protein JB92DRAFT_3116945 [Gautieria morchelliformis]|nr:hypothetical protein JB92DRAFT_3116945 [Gautieria morchelliformis]
MIVSQAAPPMLPPNSSASTSLVEHLHIFYHGRKATPVLPAPTWLQEKGKAVSNAAKGGLKARMPSLGVEVKVDIGDRVEIGLALIMLESMKTETVHRADGAGSIKETPWEGNDGMDLQMLTEVMDSSEVNEVTPNRSSLEPGLKFILDCERRTITMRRPDDSASWSVARALRGEAAQFQR